VFIINVSSKATTTRIIPPPLVTKSLGFALKFRCLAGVPRTVRVHKDHHRDPFDRMLIAQSLMEPLCLVNSDAIVAKYNANIIKV
jgi:hypothetical protein